MAPILLARLFNIVLLDLFVGTLTSLLDLESQIGQLYPSEACLYLVVVDGLMDRIRCLLFAIIANNCSN